MVCIRNCVDRVLLQFWVVQTGLHSARFSRKTAVLANGYAKEKEKIREEERVGRAAAPPTFGVRVSSVRHWTTTNR